MHVSNISHHNRLPIIREMYSMLYKSARVSQMGHTRVHIYVHEDIYKLYILNFWLYVCINLQISLFCKVCVAFHDADDTIAILRLRDIDTTYTTSHIYR